MGMGCFLWSWFIIRLVFGVAIWNRWISGLSFVFFWEDYRDYELWVDYVGDCHLEVGHPGMLVFIWDY